MRIIDRPGSVQSNIVIGHAGVPRLVADHTALEIVEHIYGGSFGCRLNTRLREEKGYTYGAGAGFDMRRGAGPFVARAAVNTEVTVPAILDMLGELDRIRDTDVEAAELGAARDYLVGVFPLRFETAGAVVGAISGLAVHELELDELVGYRGRIEAVDLGAVAEAARSHLHVDAAAIVLVGDADAFGDALEAAGLGSIVIERDPTDAAADQDGVIAEVG